MNATDFAATADLCGRRIALRWTVFPDPGGALPRITLRRKQRDFNFPADAAPYLIYDSAAFPPAQVAGRLVVHQLPGAQQTVDGLRCTERSHTVALLDNGRPVEILRATQRLWARLDHTVVRQDTELLDAGAGPDPLAPGHTYYYRLDDDSDAANPLRASATPTAVHRYHQALYEALPAVYRRGDTTERPVDAGTGLLPESAGSGGQLRRLCDVFGTAVGALRSSADGLRGLRDIDLTDARFLPALAQWIGWTLTGQDIAAQRSEITSAPARYRSVGTLDGIREIIEHYTGWAVRIGEPAQNISLTNNAPQRNVFAIVERADGSFSAPDDAAAVLGLSGAAGAEITGTAGEPFALADGMSLGLSVDGAATTRVGLAATDFADVAAASAAEVAAVIARAVRSLDAAAIGGKLRLRSTRPGGGVAVPADTATLITLDGAPGGRLATATDADGADWLCYASTAGPGPAPSHLLLKARLHGRCYDARPVGTDPEPQADPAIAALSERLWCGWVSNPHSAGARLRYRLGAVPARTHARLGGDAQAPFRLVDGTTLVITGSGGEHIFTVHHADYADLSAATAAEVVAAMGAQLVGGPSVQATPAGALVLTSADTGPEVSMRVDLVKSSAAWALGFGERSAFERGGWDPDVQWGPAHDVAGVPAGRHADCTALSEPDGAVRLCWSMHDSTVWRLVTSRWTPQVLAGTAAGLKIITAAGISTVDAADGLPSNDIRAVVADADGTIWLATAAGVVSRAADAAATLTTFTTASTAGGLAADDVRAAAVGPDGTMWFATTAGVSSRAATGGWTHFGTPNPLPSNDIRAVAATLDGTIWVATAAGLAVRRAGTWHTIGLADGLPVLDTRRLAAAPDGAMWVATGAGVARVGPDATVTAFGLLGPAAAGADVRDLTIDDATVWLATAGGVVEFRGPHDSVVHAADAGIADPDCRAITAFDGEVWVGTASGIVARGADGRWTGRAPGVAAVGSLAGAWSAAGFVGDPAAGERDPHLLRDGAAVLLAAARRARTAAGDTWRLTLRRRDAAAAWSDATELTPPGAQDREPAMVRVPGGPLQVYFRSNRGGGARIWRLELTAAGAGSPPAAVTTGPSTETDPAVLGTGVTAWVLLRSDRNVALAGVAAIAGTPAPQQVSVRRFAGSATAVPADRVRNAAAGAFGELLDYTPQRPRGDPPTPTERYTAGTIALFVDRGRAQAPLGPTDPARLRQLLTEFLPANARVVTITNL
jgi:phage tail-like protein